MIWRTVRSVFGTELCPNNIWQFCSWCYTFLPDGGRFYSFGLAAICWSIWNCRNQATFGFKFLKIPFEVVFSSCVFLDYGAGLLKSDDQEAMWRGAMMLRDNVKNMMRICAAAQDDGAMD
ncbi:hypothetical protein CFC21_066332 [Triticum aestivum]|uniref:Uncharacterized protein n=2 Tax=Triticum aestivum TaxID=4565 RepID=A0A3B6KK80_WHEAT|nr:hypothetical protein CFC21_066332 [Triticum aestivum]